MQTAPDLLGSRQDRSVVMVIKADSLLEGGGFPVRRPFPGSALSQFDPFLLLDHMGPVDWPPGEAVGAPDHPHRGFEAVTYLLEGRMRHKDSMGHQGELGPGDVQWMTAGSGVVHSELPHPELLEKGGRVHGFQLWVNLPAADKMMPPRYQEVPSASIPEAISADGRTRARVIAGEALGVSAVIDTRIPIVYLHFTLLPGARYEQPVAQEHNGLVYVFKGEAKVGMPATLVGEGGAALLSDGGSLLLEVDKASKRPAELLFLAGTPLNEPVARGGPFVMNTREQIDQAFEDYKAGRMGRIDF